MKKFGKMAKVVGVILAILGLLGMILVGQSGIGGGLVNLTFGMGSALGVNSYMTPGDQFICFIVLHRVALLISGVVCFLVGRSLSK